MILSTTLAHKSITPSIAAVNTLTTNCENAAQASAIPADQRLPGRQRIRRPRVASSAAPKKSPNSPPTDLAIAATPLSSDHAQPGHGDLAGQCQIAGRECIEDAAERVLNVAPNRPDDPADIAGRCLAGIGEPQPGVNAGGKRRRRRCPAASAVPRKRPRCRSRAISPGRSPALRSASKPSPIPNPLNAKPTPTRAPADGDQAGGQLGNGDHQLAMAIDPVANSFDDPRRGVAEPLRGGRKAAPILNHRFLVTAESR